MSKNKGNTRELIGHYCNRIALFWFNMHKSTKPSKDDVMRFAATYPTDMQIIVWLGSSIK